ncbi:hypothetical protein GCM10011366_05830 [Ornithinimicrobium tianjinense]|uniref:2-oxoacid dehydrogenase acyltransferase catalytic domain-containing protein n=2 Tax=Ornithinimicrobium tianjinense TaxID=1195761 RepID=A0A917BFE2_9MICO|nr:2-oxo acid dehydrogenase subunit E2 [Ornithinimicrobium tianjinense]GGF40960.1 hypothetical protein GCM10011366_05830 [Ornithinimicrobium tianjinense]
MYVSGGRLRTGRRDGHLVEDLPALRKVVPHLMATRLEGTIYYTQHLDVEHLMDWLDEVNAGLVADDPRRVKFFHVFLTAYARLFRVRPELNRFISGRRTYEHREISFSFTVKQAMTESAPDLQARIVFTGTETVEEARARVEEVVTSARAGTQSEDDPLTDVLVRLPVPVVAGIARVAWTLDAANLLPRFLQDAVPVYASSYLVNLGSLGGNAPFHHLYQRGTASIFTSIGTIEPEPVVDASGQVVARRRVDVVYTVDERATDGFYLVRSAELLQSMLADPESLTRPVRDG